MKDITHKFKTAISVNNNWSLSTFFDVLDVLKNNNVEIFYWDGEENWASMGFKDKTVGYVWRKYPIIIFEKNEIYNIEDFLKNIEDIEYIKLNSLNEDLFTITDDSLNTYFEGFLDFKSFTMEDVWFNTNSI